MNENFKINSYEEAFYGFQERGLYLDTPKEEFSFKEKSDCHCLKHPDNKMKYAWRYVKLGRFSCKECKKEKPYKTRTIDEKIKSITNLGYKYIDGDLSCVTNSIIIECKEGHQFKRPLKNLEKGNTQCPFCNGKIASGHWNINICQEWLDKEMPGYKILNFKQKDRETRVELKCPIKSHPSYWTAWGHIINGKTGCKLCYYDRNGKTDWNLDNAKKYLSENGFEMLNESDYMSSHKPVYCRDSLGFIYQVRIHFLLRRDGAFSLLKNNKYAVHNINLFMKLYRPDYQFLDEEYKGYEEKHKWKYLGTGLLEGSNPIFEQTVGAMITSYCKHPHLTMSQLELHCKFILDKYNLEYETQKTFPGCVGKYKLRYDFYLQLNDKEYCIETDGLQHDIPVTRFGGIKEFEKRKKYDEIKNNYCKDNNIELIRIKYNEYKNMENILVEKFELNKEEHAA